MKLLNDYIYENTLNDIRNLLINKCPIETVILSFHDVPEDIIYEIYEEIKEG